MAVYYTLRCYLLLALYLSDKYQVTTKLIALDVFRVLWDSKTTAIQLKDAHCKRFAAPLRSALTPHNVFFITTLLHTASSRNIAPHFRERFALLSIPHHQTTCHLNVEISPGDFSTGDSQNLPLRMMHSRMKSSIRVLLCRDL